MVTAKAEYTVHNSIKCSHSQSVFHQDACDRDLQVTSGILSWMGRCTLTSPRAIRQSSPRCFAISYCGRHFSAVFSLRSSRHWRYAYIHTVSFLFLASWQSYNYQAIHSLVPLCLHSGILCTVKLHRSTAITIKQIHLPVSLSVFAFDYAMLFAVSHRCYLSSPSIFCNLAYYLWLTSAG